MLTEACCFDMGDCDSRASLQCPSCGQKDSDLLIGNGYCDGFLFHASCCFDGGDCGCPTCPMDTRDIGNENCDRLLDTLDSCYDGGDCQCIEVTVSTQDCCPESGSKWCFPPNAICPTCSMDLAIYLNNESCDRSMASERCCYDATDCHSDPDAVIDYLVDKKRYRVVFVEQ